MGLCVLIQMKDGWPFKVIGSPVSGSVVYFTYFPDGLGSSVVVVGVPHQILGISLSET